MSALTRLRDFGARYIDYSTAWKAALILGAIVWLINASHGAVAALPAAAKQAAYTFFVAGFVVRLCETLATNVNPRLLGLFSATLIPSCVAIGLTYLLHSLRGTPEPFLSTIPTLLLAPPSFLV